MKCLAGAAVLTIVALTLAGCDEPHPTPPGPPRENPHESSKAIRTTQGSGVDSEIELDVVAEGDLEGGAGVEGEVVEVEVDRSLGISRDAKLETLAMLRDDLAAVRHASDGGGRAWIESITDENGEPVALQTGSRARITLVYEAGPLGIAEGGVLYFQVSPFWGWDPPQNVDDLGRGYTTTRSLADGVAIAPLWLGSELLSIEIQGRPLAEGERIEIVYGAGPALARVDRFAERRARLWLAVDGDGDGIRGLIAKPPTVDIGASSPARLLAVLPTSARPGEKLRLRLSLLDYSGNTGFPFEGEVALSASPGLALPKSVRFEAKHRGRRSVDVVAERPGVHRIEAHAVGSESLFATSNPLVVREGIAHVRWGDLHGHSQLSDGTGTPEDYFTYARDVAGLDVVALTDHDHWGMRPLDATRAYWDEIRADVARFYEPGRFVTLLGYEWTSWVHGHRHVLYFSDDGEILSTLDRDFETPAQLWEGLAGTGALTFAHHSAGGPISTNWAYVPPPEIEPVTEIVSVHGSSEAPDSPNPIYNPVPGNFVRDMLDLGAHFGFIGSGDSHDGHPGQAHLASPGGGGLAAIASETLTREGIREALLARRVYATNGARIWLEVEIDGHPMGSTIAQREGTAPQHLRIHVVADSALERVDVIRGGRIAPIAFEEGELEAVIEREIPPLHRGEYHYVRVVQEDGGAAWSSPITVR